MKSNNIANNTVGRKVVVADGARSFQLLLKIALTKEGYQVAECGSGADCLKLVEEHRPALIVIGNTLPDIEALEVIRQIRDCTDTRHIPIMLMYANEDDFMKTGLPYQAGADDFMIQPIKRFVFYARVRRLVALSDVRHLMPERIYPMKKKILVMDSMISIYLSIRMLLYPKGYRTFFKAENSDECMEAATREQPDLIVINASGWNNNGLDVARKLKTANATSHIPIIFISTLNKESDFLMAYASGASDYIAVPYNKDELIERIEHVLREGEATKFFID